MTDQIDRPPDDAACIEALSARSRALEIECAALRDALAQKHAALRQTRHRMKNDLQVIMSLLNLQASHAADPSVALHLGKVADRIRALAVVHELAQGADDVATVNMDVCLRKLVEQAVSAQSLAGVTLDFDLAPVEVPISLAIDAAMLVNELVSNALQHAFPHGRGGTVRVGFAIGPGGMRLEVSDDGVGCDPSAAPSLGMTLVRVLAKRLGTLTLETERGTRACIELCSAPDGPVAST